MKQPMLALVLGLALPSVTARPKLKGKVME
jgi:hypothetical protein